MKELGEAINQSLSDSERIAEVMARIKASGYDIFLVLEATIGFSRREDGEEPGELVNVECSDPEFRVTSQDVRFLKSLRISVESSE